MSLEWHYDWSSTSGTGRVLQWNSSYGYLEGQGNDTCLTWSKDGVVIFRDSFGSLGTEGQVLTRSATGNKLEWAAPSTKAIQVAGLQLGAFKYRRSGDDFVAGSIKSNTTTNPKNITRIDLWESNWDDVEFGKEFYETYIQPKMYLHIRDSGSGKYVGRITTVNSLTDGIRLTLTADQSLSNGSFYVNNIYDVSIGYCKHNLTYPDDN